MKKEYLAIFAVALFILGYVLDMLAGSLLITLKNPFDFLKPTYLNTYPFTTVSIAMKSVALFTGTLLVLTFIEKKYLAKGVFLLFLAAMMELYSIQQIATRGNLIPLVWSIALAFTGVFLILPSILFLILGLVKIAQKNISSDPYDKFTKEPTDNDDEI